MKFRNLTIFGLFAALASVAAPLLAEGDPAAGKNKTAMCAGCHGIPGFRTAYPETYQVPKIGGQNPGYIVAALKAYKAGERNHPTMKAIASSLTEQDMADLAAYYADAGKK
ncbi:MAG TPA: c-type cytochrome [Burkholderiales bacterium]|jgi:cytochrome c553|nr:c-type cytochrome [Burkholderiales bacterium]